jgi:hypothetical protein
MAINKWKVVAIIFIILFTLETSLLYYAYNVGVETTQGRFKCSQEVCANINADAFTYDDNTALCSCYSDNQIIKQVVMK